MPNIRFTNWNIENLSINKLNVPGVVGNLARAIVAAQADVVIVLEVSAGTALAAINLLSYNCGLASVSVGGNMNDYSGWLISHPTGGECYAVLIRDLNQVRPVHVVGGPIGTAAIPLMNLDENQFATWPGPFAGAGAVANAYGGAGLAAAAARPRLPLEGVYATNPPVGRTVRRFAGRILAQGGYALGRGFRMPCLALFEVLNGAGGAPHLIPVLACHQGAVRGGSNFLARRQIEQYRETHIAQKFTNGGYIDLNNAAVPVQDLIITGDFNVDFLQQAPPLAANAMNTGNRNAFDFLTTTTTNGGSAAPAALPGVPALPVPAVPFAAPAGGWPDGPMSLTIPKLNLRTADTGEGTILHHYNAAAAVPANLAALRSACFDNFFFGGVQLSATMQTLTPAPAPGNAAEVLDIPQMISQPLPGGIVGPPAAINVSFVHGNYTFQMGVATAAAAAAGAAPPPPPPPHFKYCYAAPNLATVAGGAALNMNDRLIGTRFLSDHLPVTVQFNLP
ncbi:hypothetical protein [Roseibium sp.]|uniref:hypothetical protein n=1 Tax=Roseibium sp. TaxID=1936156 RepID=UPI003A9702E0